MYELVDKFKKNAQKVVEESKSKAFIKVHKRGQTKNILQFQKFHKLKQL